VRIFTVVDVKVTGAFVDCETEGAAELVLRHGRRFDRSDLFVRLVRREPFDDIEDFDREPPLSVKSMAGTIQRESHSGSGTRFKGYVSDFLVPFGSGAVLHHFTVALHEKVVVFGIDHQVVVTKDGPIGAGGRFRAVGPREGYRGRRIAVIDFARCRVIGRARFEAYKFAFIEPHIEVADAVDSYRRRSRSHPFGNLPDEATFGAEYVDISFGSAFYAGLSPVGDVDVAVEVRRHGAGQVEKGGWVITRRRGGRAARVFDRIEVFFEAASDQREPGIEHAGAVCRHRRGGDEADQNQEN
jgi:hypothetical protein